MRKYQQYIYPIDNSVKHISKEITQRYKQKTKTISECYQWVCNNISHIIGSVQRPKVTFANRKGNCLSQAILLCSLLRGVGLTSEEVFVVICKGSIVKPYYHGVVLTKRKNGWLILDPAGKKQIYTVSQENLYNLLRNFNSYLIFTNNQCNKIDKKKLFEIKRRSALVFFNDKKFEYIQ